MKRNIANKSAKALALGLAVALGSSTAISGVVSNNSVKEVQAAYSGLPDYTPGSNDGTEIQGKYVATEDGMVFKIQIASSGEYNASVDSATAGGEAILEKVVNPEELGLEGSDGDITKPFKATIESGVLKIKENSGTKGYKIKVKKLGNGENSLGATLDATVLTKTISADLTHIQAKAFENSRVTGDLDFSNTEFDKSSKVLGADAFTNATFEGTLKLKGNISEVDFTTANIKKLELASSTTLGTGKFAGATLGELVLDNSQALAKDTFKGVNIGTVNLSTVTTVTTAGIFNGATLGGADGSGTITLKEDTVLSGDGEAGPTITGTIVPGTTIAANAFKGSTIAGTVSGSGVGVTTTTNAFAGATFKGATIDLSNSSTTSLSADAFTGATFELGGADSNTKNTIKLDNVTEIQTNTFKDLDLTNVQFPTESLAKVASIKTDAFRGATLEGHTLVLKANLDSTDKIEVGAFDAVKGNFKLDLSNIEHSNLADDAINLKAFSNSSGTANIIISVPSEKTQAYTTRFEGWKNITIGDNDEITTTALVETPKQIKITFSKPVTAKNLANFAEVLTLTKAGSTTNLISESTQVPEGAKTEYIIDLKEDIVRDDVLTLKYRKGSNKIVDNLGQEIGASITVKNTVGKTAPKVLNYYSTGTSDQKLYIEFDQPVEKTGSSLQDTFGVAKDTVSAAEVLSENKNIVKLTLSTGITDNNEIALTYTPSEGNYIHLEGYPTQKVEKISYTGVPKNNSEESDNSKAPVVKSARVDETGKKVILTFDEPITLGGTANQVFTVKSGINIGNEVDNTVEDAVAKGKTVEITLTAAVHKGDYVKVTYTSDASTNNVKDLFGNKAETLNIPLADTNGVTGVRDTVAPVVKGTAFAYNDSSSKGIIEIPFDKAVQVNGDVKQYFTITRTTRADDKDEDKKAGFVTLTVNKTEVNSRDGEADPIKGNETLVITLNEELKNGDVLSLSYTNNNEDETDNGNNISNISQKAFVKNISVENIAMKQILKITDIIETKEGYKFKVLQNKENGVSTNNDGSVNVAFVEKVDTVTLEKDNTTTIDAKNIEVKNGTFEVVGNKIVVSQIGADGTAVVAPKGLTVAELENIGALAKTLKENALKDLVITGKPELILKNVTTVEPNALAISSDSTIKTVYLPKEKDINLKEIFGTTSSVTKVVVESTANVVDEESNIKFEKKNKAKIVSTEISNSNKNTITIKFDKDINAESVVKDDIKVSVNNTIKSLRDVSVSGGTLTIKLNEEIQSNDTVTVTLNIEDKDYFEVSLTAYAIKNNVTSSSNNNGSNNSGGSNGGGSYGNAGSGSAVINPENTTTSGNVTEAVTEATTKDLSFDTVKLPSVGEALSFTDVPTTHWANSSISKLSAMGVINGMPNGSFNANGNSKRADVAIMFVRLLGLEGASSSTFADVPYNAYYANSVGLAKDYGIINGTSNGNFNPNGNITRQDTMVMIDRVLRSLDIPVNTDTTVLAQFADTSKISGYALESVASLVNSGIINGNAGKINPTSPITRAEIATIMDRLYTIIEEASKKATTETTTEEKSSEATSESKSTEGSTETTTEKK